jgi:hypothetical protein
MPSVTNQKMPTSKAAGNANGQARPPAKAGSLLAELIPVKDLQDDFITMCLYGSNRVGKTYLSCQFPKPLALLSCEPEKGGGAKTVKLVPGIFIKKIRDKAHLIGLAEELAHDTYFKTVVIDSATSLQDLILKELMGLAKVPVQLNWGTVPEDAYRERSEQAKEVLRLFLEDVPKNIIVTAKEKDHTKREERQSKQDRLRTFVPESFFSADLGAATAGWLADACSYLGRLYVEKELKLVRQEVQIGEEKQVIEEWVPTGRSIRRLRTMYHQNFAAGFKSERPENVPEWINNPSFKLIEKVIKGERLPEKDAYYQSQEG